MYIPDTQGTDSWDFVGLIEYFVVFLPINIYIFGKTLKYSSLLTWWLSYRGKIGQLNSYPPQLFQLPVSTQRKKKCMC
jgi:hypothetical protein